ncbi:MAG: argininosuccinate lyase [Bacteroidota bacterium]|jgi:argininosuccinate lyase
MKLWQKQDTATHEMVERFTVGQDRELDLQLAQHDIEGSLAHVNMLSTVGLLTQPEAEKLTAELKKLYKNVLKKQFHIENGVEDVHSQIEFLLTKKLGEVGKKIHAGRSRNDQVLVDLKLFFRAELDQILSQIEILFDTFLQKSEANQHILMPGYTHLQVAMVSSFGLWFAAYAETLCDDAQLVKAAYRIANQNPLGSGAGYGGSLPLNRTLTTQLLGFDDLNYNVIHAQIGRGKTEHAIGMALAGLGNTLSKFSMDCCLFLSQNFDFLHLPPHLTTGSSIMPHKKNPDVFELLRGRANRLQALPNEVAMLTSNLPSGYHRDFQLLKEIMFPALESLKWCLEMTNFMVKNLEVKENILTDPKYRYVFSVEKVNEYVLKNDIPFREAYKKVGESIENGDFEFDAAHLAHTHEGSIGNLCNAQIRQKMARILGGGHFGKERSHARRQIKKLVAR